MKQQLVCNNIYKCTKKDFHDSFQQQQQINHYYPSPNSFDSYDQYPPVRHLQPQQLQTRIAYQIGYQKQNPERVPIENRQVQSYTYPLKKSQEKALLL